MTESIEAHVVLKGTEPLVHHDALVAGVQPVAADGGHDAERLDAAAGCEFVDDRIRVLE